MRALKTEIEALSQMGVNNWVYNSESTNSNVTFETRPIETGASTALEREWRDIFQNVYPLQCHRAKVRIRAAKSAESSTSTRAER